MTHNRKGRSLGGKKRAPITATQKLDHTLTTMIKLEDVEAGLVLHDDSGKRGSDVFQGARKCPRLIAFDPCYSQANRSGFI